MYSAFSERSPIAAASANGFRDRGALDQPELVELGAKAPGPFRGGVLGSGPRATCNHMTGKAFSIQLNRLPKLWRGSRPAGKGGYSLEAVISAYVSIP